MQYARIFKNTVAEVFTAPEGLTLANCFHPDIVSQFIVANDDVKENWTYINGVFAPPEIIKQNNQA